MVGAHILLRLLDADYSVIASYRDVSGIDKAKKIFSFYCKAPDIFINKIEWVKVDIEDQQQLAELLFDVKCVINCAAKISFNKREADQTIKQNIAITSSVVDAAIMAHVPRFIHISSIAALGSAVNGEQIDESHYFSSVKNKSAYSISKFESEMEVWRGVSQGLNAVILNPSVILGPGDWENGSPSLIKKVAKGMPFFTNTVNGFIDVNDVAKISTKLIESDISGERFVLSSQNISYKSLFTQIANNLQTEPPKYEFKPWAVKPLIGVGKVLSFVGIANNLNRTTFNTIFNSCSYDGSLIIDRLKTHYTSFGKTLSRITDAYSNDNRLK